MTFFLLNFAPEVGGPNFFLAFCKFIALKFIRAEFTIRDEKIPFSTSNHYINFKINFQYSLCLICRSLYIYIFDPLIIDFWKMLQRNASIFPEANLLKPSSRGSNNIFQTVVLLLWFERRKKSEKKHFPLSFCAK